MLFSNEVSRRYDDNTVKINVKTFKKKSELCCSEVNSVEWFFLLSYLNFFVLTPLVYESSTVFVQIRT